jgi:hypothetical protein
MSSADTDGGYTVQGGARSVAERSYIESALADALDEGPLDTTEMSVRVDVEMLTAQAERVAAERGSAAARGLLMEEARRCRRWLRAIHLGLAGNDAIDHAGLTQGWLGNLARVTLPAVIHGLRAGVPAEQLVRDIVASGAIEVGEAGYEAIAPVLAHCLSAQDRPDLALSVLIRSPVTAPAGYHLRTMLHAARMTWARGHADRIGELLELGGWDAPDPSGLARELLRTLVEGQEPSPAELAVRAQARQQAFQRGDAAALRELALFDVMWMEESSELWLALSAILRLNGADAQADLAREAGHLVAGEAGPHE